MYFEPLTFDLSAIAPAGLDCPYGEVVRPVGRGLPHRAGDGGDWTGDNGQPAERPRDHPEDEGQGRCGLMYCVFVLCKGVVSCLMYMYITCRFKSHQRQLIFLRKSDCLGCAVLLCLVVCLTMLASSLINTCTLTVCLYCAKVVIDDLCTNMVGKSGNKAVVSLATCTCTCTCTCMYGKRGEGNKSVSVPVLQCIHVHDIISFPYSYFHGHPLSNTCI